MRLLRKMARFCDQVLLDLACSYLHRRQREVVTARQYRAVLDFLLWMDLSGALNDGTLATHGRRRIRLFGHMWDLDRLTRLRIPGEGELR